MEALKWLPFVFLALAIAGIVGGASAITIAKFKATTNDSGATAVLNNVSSGLQTMGEQMPTVSTIAIMVVIITLLAGLFVYFKWFRG